APPAVRTGQAAGAGGEAAGTVRSCRYPAHRERTRGGDAAFAVAGAAPDPGDAGSARFLGTHLPRGEKGIEGPLSTPSLARRSVERQGHRARQAARDLSFMSH